MSKQKFGRYTAEILDDDERQNIIQHLCDKWAIQLHEKNYKFLDYKNFKFLRQRNYTITLNPFGHKYLLYLTKDHGCLFINKKTHVIYKIHMTFIDEELFNETIFDGVILCDNNKHWQFYISDLLVYKGLEVVKNKFKERFELIHDIINNNFTPSNKDNFKFIVAELFEYCHIEDLSNNYRSQLKFKTNGLIFKNENNHRDSLLFIYPENRRENNQNNNSNNSHTNNHIGYDNKHNHNKHNDHNGYENNNDRIGYDNKNNYNKKTIKIQDDNEDFDDQLDKELDNLIETKGIIDGTINDKDECDKDDIDDKCIDVKIDDDKKKNITKKLNNGVSKNLIGIFGVKKSDLPDVYELYVDDNDYFVSYGLGYIKDVEHSNFMMNIFSTTNHDVDKSDDDDDGCINMKCEYMSNIGKWTPIDKSDKDIYTSKKIKSIEKSAGSMQ